MSEAFRITINGKLVVGYGGETIHTAAKRVGIDIPTLCFDEACGHINSCMLCMVRDAAADALVPACSSPVKPGMVIETETEAIREYRRECLELLLSEHVGDCEGPCQTTCPAHMDIPLMLRQIQGGKRLDALQTVKARIALPSVLGRICPAPCQRACRRGRIDETIDIARLERFVGDMDLASEAPDLPPRLPHSGKRVAIVGAGPAGLSAAWYLLQAGHGCTVFDRRNRLGGMLQYGVSPDVLPREVLEDEIQQIRRLGALFRPGTCIGTDVPFAELVERYDAVVVAAGGGHPHEPVAAPDLERNDDGIVVDPATLATSQEGVFAGGDAVKGKRLAVRAVGDGWRLAQSVDAYLRGVPADTDAPRFNSHFGALQPGDAAVFLKEASAPGKRADAPGGADYDAERAIAEAGRCLHCDCRKPDSCRLRDYAGAYEARPMAFKAPQRGAFLKQDDHPAVIFEPGKCIKCGICVRICEGYKDEGGLAFHGRSYGLCVATPLGDPMSEALHAAAADCVDACPTGALAWKEG
jgi:ferredoxin